MKCSLILLISFLSYGCNNQNKEKINNGKEQSIEISQVLGQPKDSLITLLTEMKYDSLDCNSDVYWKIIKRGKASIPLLIESLTDTTMTNVYNPCKHGKLNVGEISYFALQEIAEFPAFLVTHIQFDLINDNGCWNFYDYLFKNSNKQEYQKMVRDFYTHNKYVYVKFDKRELNECRKHYQIYGKLKMESIKPAR
jgi:hypothetical protein